MEHIKEALIKARVSLEEPSGLLGESSAKPGPGETKPSLDAAREATPTWSPRQARLDPRHMEEKRIVSFAMSDPNHVAFNQLRTRVRKVLTDSNWKKLAITSPSAGCGKTVVGVNLAFSLARTPDCRVVLIDLDLKKPAVAATLGIEPTASLGRFLQGGARAKDCFVEVSSNLFFGLNNDRIRASSELIQGPRMRELIDFIDTSLSPDIVLFDLPPLLSSDDSLAFLPQVDTALLVIASGKTTIPEVDECEQQMIHMDRFLGVVMNKADSAKNEYYYY